MAEVTPAGVAAGVVSSRASNVKAGSQAGAYAALLFGGVLIVAAAKGDSIRNILSGVASPIRPLTSSIPSSFPKASGSSGGSTSNSAFNTGSTAVSAGAAGAVTQAESLLGIKGGSAAVSHWDEAIGAAPGIPWCSAFASAVLRRAGVKNLPADAAYSGAWLNWSGGTNLHTTSLAKARPGDLLIFDWGDGGQTDHVAVYTGHNQMISGNDSNDSVGKSSVPTGNIVGIVRPHYPGTGKGAL